MFLKSLRITGIKGEIRNINFRSGVNLIVDSTISSEGGDKVKTGNNVGKTTVLALIDYCLGGDEKGVFIDKEFGKPDEMVKKFLTSNEVMVTLELVSSLSGKHVKAIKIERNFLKYKKKIMKINGESKNDKEFVSCLQSLLFPNQLDTPPFRHVIAHNIRYEPFRIENTLTIHSFFKNEESQALYLFLLGCEYTEGKEREVLLADLKIETNFKKKLEGDQSLSFYESTAAIVDEDIRRYQKNRSELFVNPQLEKELRQLNETQKNIKSKAALLGKLELKENLIKESIDAFDRKSVDIDLNEVQAVYSEVSEQMPAMQKSFDDLVRFHNSMIEEKIRYISKNLPELSKEIINCKDELRDLIALESCLANKLQKNITLTDLEELNLKLNLLHEEKGRLEAIIEQITAVDIKLKELNVSIENIDAYLFSDAFKKQVQEKVNDFTIIFSDISQKLYGERYGLNFEIREDKKTKKQFYHFNTFNANMSPGKKQGEVFSFDIAYTLFADARGIPCYHFLLNDRKELMHGNQLNTIIDYIEEKKEQLQLVVSILKDKLPNNMDIDKYSIIELSQKEKLFKIESHQ